MVGTLRRFAIGVGVVALPILEIWLVVVLVQRFGWAPVIIAGALFFGFGLAMLRRATDGWASAVTRAQQDRGYAQQHFGTDFASATLLFVGGLLLILPGFITGVLGLLLVLPPVRRAVGRLFNDRLTAFTATRGYSKVTIIEGETVWRGPQDPAADADAGPQVIVGEIVSGPDDDEKKNPPPPVR